MMEQDLKIQLAAGRVDASGGIIYDVTIAKAGVNAVGKFVLVDGAGHVIKDPLKAVRKLPVYTDDRTLETLMGAFQDAGNRIKSRIDHNDSIEARIGWTDNPRRIGDRVVGDLHLLQTFGSRDVILEVAERTPELMAMSIDFIPSFEIKGGKAFMRIELLTAADVVDEGAVCPAGMFLNRGRVDTEHKPENPQPTMPDAKPAPMTPEAMEAAIKELSARCDGLIAKHADLDTQHKALLAKHGELEAAHKTLAAAVGKPPVDADKDGMAAVRKEFTDGLSALRTEIVDMKKERAALGMKAGGDNPSGKPGTGPSADIAANPGARDGEKPKTYLQLVAEKRESMKCSASVAHQTVQHENPDAYRLHLEGLGTIKPAAKT
jgi:hypothetical protein